MNHKNQDIFTRFTTRVASILGRAWIFVTALIILAVWAVTGPILGFSDTWQLIINTGTTIITFLMVFIIQNTQNRDNMAINIKLDALMKKSGINAEELFQAEEKSDKELERDKRRIQPNTKKSHHKSRRKSST